MTAPRILVIRLTALGDVVLAEPVARALGQRFPGYAIDLVTDLKMVPLLTQAGAFDRVEAYDKKGADRGLLGPWRVRRRLAPHYHAVIDLQGKLRTRALSHLVSAEHKLTLKKRSFGAALWTLIGRRRPITDRHTIDLYLDLLAPLGLGRGSLPKDVTPRLRLPAPARAGLRRVGLGIGASHPTKRWAPEQFRALVAGILARAPNVSVTLIGGPQDRAELERVRQLLPPAALDPRDATQLDVAGLASLIGELDVMVSVDSGAAHISQGLGVRTIVLFGPTSPLRWGPRAAPHRAISLGLDCAPCSDVGGPACPRPDRAHACMRELPAERVVALVFEDP